MKDLNKLCFLPGSLLALKEGKYNYISLLKQGLTNLGVTYPNSGGGGSQPAGQIVYGSGSGVTSDSAFTYDLSDKSLNLNDKTSSIRFETDHVSGAPYVIQVNTTSFGGPPSENDATLSVGFNLINTGKVVPGVRTQYMMFEHDYYQIPGDSVNRLDEWHYDVEGDNGINYRLFHLNFYPALNASAASFTGKVEVFNTGQINSGFSSSLQPDRLLLAKNGSLSILKQDGVTQIPMFILNTSDNIQSGAILDMSTYPVKLDGGINNTSTRPSYTTTPGSGEITGYSATLPADNVGFLRLSAGGAASGSQKSAIDITGFSTIPDMDRTITLSPGATPTLQVKSRLSKFIYDTTNFSTLRTASNSGLELYPSVNSTTAFKFMKSDATTSIMSIDSTNGRVGIGITAPAASIHTVGDLTSVGGTGWGQRFVTNQTVNTTAEYIGSSFESNITTSASNSSTVSAQVATVTYSATGNHANILNGYKINANFTGSGTLPTLTGVDNSGFIGNSATITNYYGNKFIGLFTPSTGTVVNQFGYYYDQLYVTPSNKGYAFYSVVNPSGGTLASATDISIRPGATGVAIGKLTPTQMLDVNGNIVATGTITPSDARWKENISAYDNALGLINNLKPVSYEYKKDTGKAFGEGKQYGLIAQEVEEIIPEIVNTDVDGYKGIEYTELISIQIKAIQELSEEIAKLKIEIKTLKQI